ncbi:hypothetical protein DsansV1_C15g0132431 [Dioscorea sansibarensis]
MIFHLGSANAFIALNSNCFLNLHNLRLYGVNSFQHFRRAHEPNKPKKEPTFRFNRYSIAFVWKPTIQISKYS